MPLNSVPLIIKLKPVDLQQFINSLNQVEPPEISPLLLALWYDAKGGWDKAHSIVQDMDGASASWIHAYLHRKEGDLGNAGYWYRRAGKDRPTKDFQSEWEEIVQELL